MTAFPLRDFFTDWPFPELLIEGDSVWSPLLRIEEFFFQKKTFRIGSEVLSTVYLKNPEQIAIGSKTVIESGAYLEGPCIVGDDCVIRHGAYIRPYTILSDGCMVGHGSEIKHSILLPGAQAAHFNYVGDSILGNRVNLGAGVKCANLRLDRKEVCIVSNGRKISTGLKKFGCILGDGVQIGCNAVVNPGTLMGPKSVAYPLLVLQGVIPAGSQIKGGPIGSEISSIPAALLQKLCPHV